MKGFERNKPCKASQIYSVIWQMLVKITKKNVLLIFDSVAGVWVLSDWVEDAPLRQLFLINLYLFDSILLAIVWTDKLRHFVDGISLLNNGCHGNGKKDTISVIIATVEKRKNTSSKIWLLSIRATTDKIEIAE